MTSSSLLLENLLAVLDQIASFSLAESWDNVGLIVGDPQQEVSGILVALDPTEDVLDEAISLASNIIITHHPLIFKPISSIRTDQPLGRFLEKALRNNIGVVGCHTNLDAAVGGVSDILAVKMGLVGLRPLSLSKNHSYKNESVVEQNGAGFGRIGYFSPPLSTQQFIACMLDTLAVEAIQLVGILPAEISVAAVCGGSGAEFAETAFKMGAQVYITSEIKLSVARWVEMSGFCMVDGGHFATEKLVVPMLTTALQEAFIADNLTVKVRAASGQQNPFRYCTKK